MSVLVDAGPVREAIAAFSQVTVDVSGSTGQGPLSFSIDFGDGSKSATSRDTHVYANPGAFTVTAEVRDAQGRVASRTQAVVVKRLVGSWFSLGYNATTKRAEVQRIEVQSQDGATIRGLYRRTGDADVAFTGALRAPRDIQIIAGSIAVSGAIPSELISGTEPWRLEVRGGGYNGEPVGFRAVAGPPTSGEPDARLAIRNMVQPGVAWAGLTELEFDASSSQGDGLSYLIEFGDGQFSAVSRAPRVVDPTRPAWEATARITVVDRFGRVNTESTQYGVLALNHAYQYNVWHHADASYMSFQFGRRVGARYEGTLDYRLPPNQRGDLVRTSVVATMSGERDVVIVVESLGLELRGRADISRVVFTPSGLLALQPNLVVTQRGGHYDGATWTLSFDDGPG